MNCEYKIIKGKSNKGNEFEAIQFTIKTPLGDYKSGLCFPTPMELSIIKKYSNLPLNSDIKAIYGEPSSDIEGF